MMSRPAERYLISIDQGVTTKDELFSRFTDAAYLGYSSFSGWDAFAEMLLDRLETSDILIEVANEDLSNLSAEERAIYTDIIEDAARQFPTRLRVLQGFQRREARRSAFHPWKTFGVSKV
jgi:hypothetical protein